ncbi:MAG: DMT family transporter [Actinobacteria bacterium]|nr:DMT family transporter [Actinomycetota bacterium]
MTAVLLAVASAAFFGATSAAIRWGMRETQAAVAALAMQIPGLVIALLASAPHHDAHGTWPFLLAGLMAPGGSTILFMYAIRDIGPSRTSVAVGMAPLVSVTIALIFLGEPFSLALFAGALAIVAGGVALAFEQTRPAHLRLRGLVFAGGATLLFSIRDNLVRALHAHTTPAAAAVATLLGGSLVTLVAARRFPTGAELRRLAPAGILFGISYLCLFEAYFHGRVTVVAPLVATESLWGVVFAAVAFRGAEGVGRRLLLGAVLVVAGGALIGTVR